MLFFGSIVNGKKITTNLDLLKNKKNIAPIAIIGSGPTGLSAGLYGARSGIPTYIFTGPKPGGLIIDTRSIENWPGVPKMSGKSAIDLLRKQTEGFGACIVPKTIIKVDFSQWPFILSTQDGEKIAALSVIIATGAVPRKLGVKGENVYWNKGILSCALCDAPLSKGQQTVVIGDDDLAIERVFQLAPYASAIELLVPGPQLNASYHLQEKLRELPQLHISYNTKVKKVLGNGKRVTDLLLRNTQSKKETLFKTRWVYLSVGFEPDSTLFKHILKLTPTGYIKADCETQKTSIPGIFAAGAVVSEGRKNQVSLVTAQGIKAALSAIDFVRKLGPDSKTKPIIEKILYKPVIPENGDEKKICINNQKEFKEKVLESKRTVLLYLFDPACAHCSKTKPNVIEVANDKPERVYLLDMTQVPDIAAEYKVSHVPSYILFKDGKEIARASGPMSKKKIEQFLKKKTMNNKNSLVEINK